MSKEAAAAAPALDPEIEAMSFEQALAALEQIVSRLESGKIDLEESIDLYERGAQLRQRCETKLKAAEMRVEQIVRNAEGGADGLAPVRRAGALSRLDERGDGDGRGVSGGAEAPGR